MTICDLCGVPRELEHVCVDALKFQRESDLKIMSTLHSLLSLVRHRHLPRGLDSLEKDIDKILGQSEKALDPWWKKNLQVDELRKSADASHLAASENAKRASEAEAKLRESERLNGELKKAMSDIVEYFNSNIDNKDICYRVREIAEKYSERPKCVCGGVGLGVACEPGCPNYSEKRFCECRPMTYQMNGATGNCIKCGRPPAPGTIFPGSYIP